MTEIKVKKRHHYVMQNYLERWKGFDKSKSKKEGVWVENKVRKSNYFCTDLNSISQINYFYALDVDQDVLGLLRYRYDKHPECKSTLEWLALLALLDEYKKKELYNYEKLDVINKNVLEDEYSRFEDVFARILQSIDNDLELYISSLVNKESDLRVLVFIFVFQAFRTKVMRDMLSDKMIEILVDWGDGERRLSSIQKENYLKASLYLDSISSSLRICSNDFSIELLINNNKKGFITSDAPAVIISGSDFELSKFEGFMPLTPNIGMVIRGRRLVGKNFFLTKISQQQLIRFNKLIKNSFCEQLYSKVKLWT